MTATLVNATLQPLRTGSGQQPEEGRPIAVQFNPASLRLQISNNVEIKKALGKNPPSQYEGTSTATLSFDLVFDTADLGTTEQPEDVRQRVNPLRQLLLPAPGAKAITPRVRFVYGSFRMVGIVTTLNVDYDLFSVSGVPLRAKCAVAVKELLPDYEKGKIGPATNTGVGARDDQRLLTGAAGMPPEPDRTGRALAGESAADFAARMGLAPTSWPSLRLGGLDPFALTAGEPIDFVSSASPDLGSTAGVMVGGTAGGEVLSARTPDLRAITAAGGLNEAIDHDAHLKATVAARATRSGFVVPDAPPAVPDRRALTYGYGVPLRDRIGVTAPLATAERTTDCGCGCGGCR